MNEIEFHQKSLTILPDIISGIDAETHFYDLLMSYNPYARASAINALLDARKGNRIMIKAFQQMFDESVDLLTKAGYNPFPMSKEERKAFNKEYPDPYRWRVPAWLRLPLKKLFSKK